MIRFISFWSFLFFFPLKTDIYVKYLAIIFCSLFPLYKNKNLFFFLDEQKKIDRRIIIKLPNKWKSSNNSQIYFWWFFKCSSSLLTIIYGIIIVACIHNEMHENENSNFTIQSNIDWLIDLIVVFWWWLMLFVIGELLWYISDQMKFH